MDKLHFKVSKDNKFRIFQASKESHKLLHDYLVDKGYRLQKVTEDTYLHFRKKNKGIKMLKVETVINHIKKNNAI